MLRRNYLIGAVLFAFWIAMTVQLLQREVFVPRSLRPAPTTPVSERAPRDTWMGVYSRDDDGSEDRIGYVHLRSHPGERDGQAGVRHGMTLKLATRMLSVPTELFLDGNAWVTDERGLSDFEFRMRSFDEHVLSASGAVDRGKLRLNVQTAGETFPVTVPVNTDLLVQPNFGAAPLNLPTLEIGDEIYIDAFDPVTMSSGTAHVRCVGTETIEFEGEQIATKILETELSGVTTRTWVTLDEEVMRVETLMGLVLKRISQREALEELDPADAREIIHSAAVRPTGQTPERGAQSMHFRVNRAPAQADIIEDELQRRVGDDEYTITAATPPDVPVAPEFAGLDEFLGGDAFVHTAHPRIEKIAQEIVGDETDPWRKAQLIYAWVYTNIEKSPVISVPSALDVLASRKGDCNEHTVLYTAIARTAGVPTRMAIGVVWSEELMGFYYHAWPEVYVGRWVPVDPTLGQPVADATHIKLLEGSLEQWPRLTPFLGQLDIEVLDVQ
jgi:hypothetical protein